MQCLAIDLKCCAFLSLITIIYATRDLVRYKYYYNGPVKMANFVKTLQEDRVQDGHASAVSEVLHGYSSHYILLHIHG